MLSFLRFGIALYSPLKEGEGRHWALVVGRPRDLSFDGRVRVFQIVHSGDGNGYKLSHKKATLAKSKRYCGLFDLGSVRDLLEDHVLGAIEKQPAGQDGYPLPEGKRWSCAWWVIRALRELARQQVALIPGLPASDLELYNKVVGQPA